MKSTLLIQLFLTALLVYESLSLKKKFYGLQKKTLFTLKKYEALVNELQISFETMFHFQELPAPIRHVPFADEQGIVLSIRNVEIPGILAPYNASLIANKDRYLLFFRYDFPVIGNDLIPHHAHIGAVELDRNFSPMGPHFTLDTKSSFSEDPRAIWCGGKCFVVYNDLVSETEGGREIRIAQVDTEARQVKAISRFNRKHFFTEKNWIPLALDGENLHLIYTISPHEILRIPSPESNVLSERAARRNSELSIHSRQETCRPLPERRISPLQGRVLQTVPLDQRSLLPLESWPQKWGSPRGGTPPQLIDGEYLSFFHSSFEDERGVVWYIMGAYTFEAQAPYRITKISSFPILFKGIYSSRHQNTANRKVRCIYPAGFVAENREGKELLHLSCGENDSAVKILTLDKEALFKSLKPVCFEPGKKCYNPFTEHWIALQTSKWQKIVQLFKKEESIR